MPALKSSPRLRVIGGIAAVFGVMTIFAGARALFAGADMGAVVPFVLWFNFLAGFAYVAAGVGLWRGSGWALAAALAVFCATVLVFALFGLHVLGGGAYEGRTVGAMAFRTAFWGVIAWLAAGLRARR